MQNGFLGYSMATNPINPPNDPPCGTIVYRLILRRSWIDPDDQTKIKAEAFMRRTTDEDGLSVFDSYRIEQQACIETSNSCHGIATLHVGTLRNGGLTVIRDPTDWRKILITNAPFENSGDANQEHLADTIAEGARIAALCKWRRK